VAEVMVVRGRLSFARSAQEVGLGDWADDGPSARAGIAAAMLANRQAAEKTRMMEPDDSWSER
jgi:hypothetical protein